MYRAVSSRFSVANLRLNRCQASIHFEAYVVELSSVLVCFIESAVFWVPVQFQSLVGLGVG